MVSFCIYWRRALRTRGLGPFLSRTVSLGQLHPLSSPRPASRNFLRRAITSRTSRRTSPSSADAGAFIPSNYRAPNEPQEFSDLQLPNLDELWDREPWRQEIFPDYLAPIVRADGDGASAVLANFGMIPKTHQPAGKRYMTVNARSETVGEKPAFRAAWRAGQRCLIPAAWIYEPNWETGKHVKYRIGLDGWRPFCVAGVWRSWKEADGQESIAMAMLTVNAEEHAVMKHMHKPGDEKRSVVILREGDYDDWLHSLNLEVPRSMLRLCPAADMLAEVA